MKGRIRTLEGLMQAVRRKRAIIIPTMAGARMPAAFVIEMQARLVHSYIQRSMYLYEKEKP